MPREPVNDTAARLAAYAWIAAYAARLAAYAWIADRRTEQGDGERRQDAGGFFGLPAGEPGLQHDRRRLSANEVGDVVRPDGRAAAARDGDVLRRWQRR